MSGLDYKYLSMVNTLALTWLFLEAPCFPICLLFRMKWGQLNIYKIQ